MGKRLPVPPELEHLIEKREAESDRRRQERREVELGPLGAIESAHDLDEVPTEERRIGDERRKRRERRKGRRRDAPG